MNIDERAFEDAIEASLLTNGGYLRSAPANFDPGLGLDPHELFAFIEATQPAEWRELAVRYGSEASARGGFLERLAAQLDSRGTVDVLRHGVADRGVTIQLAYFRPAHGLTPKLLDHYNANRLTVTRQLRYEPESTKTLDLVLLLNGIPTATAELKNPLTGQGVTEAIAQYRQDRDPRNVTLSRRAIVHFAVDPERVAMTTRLEGPKTQFLPFNQGSGGPGRQGGAGNPPNPAGHRTAYLWEEVWARDAWLDLLARFVHVEMPPTGRAAARRAAARIIFPRFHQWHSVRRLEDDARNNGAGQAYLIQHSAGSGKSNTIAWLAHRLSNLHDKTDRKVFDKVVVITDRVVLDRQLQETIYQFEHARGVVVKIDKDSAQLAQALAGEQARIIITTLQKFPFVLDKVGSLPARHYAVIIDEAHSSMTGESARHMKAVLSSAAGGSLLAMAAETGAEYAAGGSTVQPTQMGTEEIRTTGAGAPPIVARSDAGLSGTPVQAVATSLPSHDDGALEEAEARARAEESGLLDPQDEMASLIAGRARPSNISFFALTATPKAKTLELFGSLEDRGEGPRYYPFHLYSMKQAIEEGFILDVLANYTTYKQYYRLEKAIREDPHYDEARARRAIARFVDLHPHNLAQKSEIIVEHFRQHVRHRIGGRAKAMVVTSSRLHAVRYKLAIDKYIREQGYTDVAALVAFSGKVIDAGDEFTESGMNRFPESETAARFGGDDYQVLIVAEKFQTGFDQPLLHTMYVDKVLTGLNAVQTLSRLNRIAPGKEDTFVLDFRNDVEDIQKAFKPWFETTIATPTDPNLLYDTNREVRSFDVIRDEDIASLIAALRAGSASPGHGAVYAALDPAIDRFRMLSADEQAAFRDAMTRFINVYNFLSQVVAFTDTNLERDWQYCRALNACLPNRETERLDLGREVQLSHLRIEMTYQGGASLTSGEGTVRAIFDGRGKQHDPEEAPLSEIIKVINERFGLNLGESDRLLLEQYKAEMVGDEELAAQARANDLDQFRIVFDRKFMNHIVRRMDDNETIYKRILDDEEFRSVLFEAYLKDVYAALRQGAA